MKSLNREKLRRVAWFTLAVLLPALLSLAGCVKPIGLPSVPPPTATPTPTMVLGCQPTANLNLLSASGSWVNLPVVILPGQPTPTPGPIPWTWTGFGPPPSTGGVQLLQTAADWTNYLATSVDPAANPSIPFNPGTEVFVVVNNVGYCPAPAFYSINSVCNNGTSIQVNVDQFPPCCGPPPPPNLQSMSANGLVIKTYGLPISIVVTPHPLPSPLCA